MFYIRRTYFSTNNRNTYGWKLCSSSRRLVPLVVWGRLHTVASQFVLQKLARSFNFKYRYIDDVLSLNNSRLGDCVDGIHPIELEIKDNTDKERYASYLDLHFEIDKEGRVRTKFTTKDMILIFPLWTFHLYVATFHFN